ncbi:MULTISPECIES: helicase C-terminal domain-containing protein [Blautia]|uniref:helicase C-terminal domain-containing protein n=1 Tax=Blautia TaxID=572511 RepID=UPI001FC8E65E|nr:MULTISPECIES: helicase C-terminal domain-containing protein [Blautia]
MDIFVAEHICRKILAVDEFYFAQRPILGRGRGCAATWKANKNGRASEIVSTFIPEYEFPGVSAALEGFDPFFFSMRTLSVAKKKDDIINRLNVLANSYEDWIQKKLIHDSKMDDAKFKKEIGDTVINKCIEALGRIRAGIQLLVADHARHNRTEELPTSTLRSIKPFLPPELIIQDELHLITGPLGTVYGAYETVIEDLCSYTIGEKKIKPKYVVSTATIKNAAEQTKCLYGRKVTAQFPPNGFEIGDSFYIREVPVEQDPFRRYVGVCAPGQSVKTALLRVYSIILQSAYNLSLDDEYKDVIDPYYTLVGYYNSIRELGGAVRLLQDDIPDRIQRIKKKYGMSRQRFLNHKVEITSRMSSYDIPKKLSQLETPYTDRNCLDTAIATNMIAVGMDVDRLGLMVVTGQPKQNSEYIQATSRIGRSYPGLVVTLYNPYRPRDLSHYENFTGYHAQLYRFVEGTTATPFSARARDRVLHALVISAIRLHYPEFASNDGAAAIDKLTDEQLNEVKALIMNRLNIIKPSAKADAEHEIDDFISNWKLLATQSKELRY